MSPQHSADLRYMGSEGSIQARSFLWTFWIVLHGFPSKNCEKSQHTQRGFTDLFCYEIRSDGRLHPKHSVKTQMGVDKIQRLHHEVAKSQLVSECTAEAAVALRLRLRFPWRSEWLLAICFSRKSAQTRQYSAIVCCDRQTAPAIPIVLAMAFQENRSFCDINLARAN